MNTVPVLAEDTTDEDQLFSEDMIVSEDQIVDDTTGDELKQKHIGFSGTINSSTAYTRFDPVYDLTELGGAEADQITSQTSADIFVDIRLQNWIKGFLSLGVNYYPQGVDELNTITLTDPALIAELNTDTLLVTNKKYNDILIKEFFIDANWKNKVYFRTGKQLLKWGTGYFWNPTDLINIDRKSFLDMARVREGVSGTKITIPSGIKQNTYFFIDMNDTTKLSDISLAGKYEFLVKNTEMSFSIWAKNGYHPVYGFDISGNIFTLDYHGEIGLANDERYNALNYDTLGIKPKTGEMISQVSFGLSKSFDYGEVKDRINVTGEFFYNQAGYDKDIIGRIASESNPETKKTAQGLYLANYQPYSNSKYYAAFFGAINKFIVSDMTFSMNGLINLVDNSAVLTTGIAYNPALTDIVINFNINSYLGAQNTEATMMGKRWDVNVGAQISF